MEDYSYNYQQSCTFNYTCVIIHMRLFELARRLIVIAISGVEQMSSAPTRRSPNPRQTPPCSEAKPETASRVISNNQNVMEE